MTLEEQVVFEKQQIEKKIANVNDARKLLELLKVKAAAIGQQAVTDANSTGSYDEKIEVLFKGLQDILDMLNEKDGSVDRELHEYESQLKLLELFQSHIKDEENEEA